MAATRPTRAGRAAPAIAVQFVLNYEEGGENNILHGDAASEAFLSEIVGAQAWPGVAPHEHGIDLRVWQPRRLLAAVAACSPSAHMPVTVYGVATALDAQSRSGRRR